MNLRNSENVWVLAAFLGITGVLAALILAVVSQLTAEPVRQAKLRNELQMLKELDLPEFDNDMTTDVFNVNGVEYMAAVKNGKIVGFAARSQSSSGYSGKLKSLISFDVKGNILAVQVVEHKETPGLGANCTNDDFKDEFIGLSRDIKVVKSNPSGNQIDALSSATVTTKAVTKGVNDALKAAEELMGGDK